MNGRIFRNFYGIWNDRDSIRGLFNDYGKRNIETNMQKHNKRELENGRIKGTVKGIKMNLKDFLRGLYIILTTNPIDVLRLWSKGEDEEAQEIRYFLYMLNFITANLGIIIILLSVYVWYNVTSPNNFILRDSFGNTFNLNDFSQMKPECLLMCNNTLFNNTFTQK